MTQVTHELANVSGLHTAPYAFEWSNVGGLDGVGHKRGWWSQLWLDSYLLHLKLRAQVRALHNNNSWIMFLIFGFFRVPYNLDCSGRIPKFNGLFALQKRNGILATNAWSFTFAPGPLPIWIPHCPSKRFFSPLPFRQSTEGVCTSKGLCQSLRSSKWEHVSYSLGWTKEYQRGRVSTTLTFGTASLGPIGTFRRASVEQSVGTFSCPQPQRCNTLGDWSRIAELRQWVSGNFCNVFFWKCSLGAIGGIFLCGGTNAWGEVRYPWQCDSEIFRFGEYTFQETSVGNNFGEAMSEAPWG